MPNGVGFCWNFFNFFPKKLWLMSNIEELTWLNCSFYIINQLSCYSIRFLYNMLWFLVEYNTAYCVFCLESISVGDWARPKRPVGTMCAWPTEIASYWATTLLFNQMRDRLTAGRRVLVPLIKVRILVPQPNAKTGQKKTFSRGLNPTVQENSRDHSMLIL